MRISDWSSDVCSSDLAVAAALALTPFAGLPDAAPLVEVAVRLTDDAEVQTLKSDFRGRAKPTNVLSFPQVQADLLASLANSDARGMGGGEILIGDLRSEEHKSEIQSIMSSTYAALRMNKN